MSYKQITAAEQMMKLAVNNQNHVDSLIGYYRDLIDDFNNERSQWVLHYDNLKDTAEDQYLLDQQIQQNKQQVGQLEKKLAAKKAALTYERQKFFKFIENNEVLKKKLEQTKNNYRQAMNVCKPVGLNNNKISQSILNHHDQPKIGHNPLQLELINLTKNHNAHKNTLKSEIDLLKDQLSQLIREYADREEQCKSEYCQALQKLCQIEKKNMALTGQYFRYRSTNSQEQKQVQEESQIYRLKNLAILQKLKKLEKNHDKQFKSVDAEVKKENKMFKMQYDEQLLKKSEHLSILKEQYERIQDIYLNKIKKMQEELKKTNQGLKNCEDKSRTQINSLKSQIKILRNRLQNDNGIRKMREEIARANMNSDGEQDESSASLEISELDRINKEVKNLAKQIDETK